MDVCACVGLIYFRGTQTARVAYCTSILQVSIGKGAKENYNTLYSALNYGNLVARVRFIYLFIYLASSVITQPAI